MLPSDPKVSFLFSLFVFSSVLFLLQDVIQSAAEGFVLTLHFIYRSEVNRITGAKGRNLPNTSGSASSTSSGYLVPRWNHGNTLLAMKLNRFSTPTNPEVSLKCQAPCCDII